MKLYIAGPMTGIEAYNFPAFDDAAKQLRAAGYDVCNPAEMDREAGFDPVQHPALFCTYEMRRAFLEKDKKALETCDGIALLPGWENSPGVHEEIEHFQKMRPGAYIKRLRWWIDHAPLLAGYNPENLPVDTLLKAPEGTRLLESEQERLAFANASNGRLRFHHEDLWLLSCGQWQNWCAGDGSITYVTTRPRGWWRWRQPTAEEIKNTTLPPDLVKEAAEVLRVHKEQPATEKPQRSGAEEVACVLMPTDAAERKKIPLYRGLMRYFPDALLCVSRVSYEGNEQHHPSTPLHWDMSKSQDEEDALLRHMTAGEWDTVAWRALANLQRKINAGWRPQWARKEV